MNFKPLLVGISLTTGIINIGSPVTFKVSPLLQWILFVRDTTSLFSSMLINLKDYKNIGSHPSLDYLSVRA